MVLEPDPVVVKTIKAQFRTLPAEMATSLPYAYEINPPGVNKAASLLALLEKMHLANLPIYVPGDAENDLSIFELAQASFSPTTAHPEVLRCTDYRILREKDGLLTPILELIQSF